MSTRLSKPQRTELQNVIISKFKGEETITDEEIAKRIVSCTTRTIRRARSKILKHGTIDPPRRATGRPREVTENMWLALKNHLEEHPCLSQQSMADFLFEQYQVKVSRFNIGRVLKRAGWTKKVTRTIAKERNPDLRDDYIERRSHYKVKQMIFIDESGSDRGLAILERGYAPKGVTPVQTKRFHRGKRVQVLPAYTIDGVIYSEVYEENTDVNIVEGFLERLLPLCGRYPAPRSVIFMDNASFHFFSPALKDKFTQAGVIIEYQSPYSPDLNPIEYLFGSVKNRIRKQFLEDEDLIQGDFKSYLQMQIRVVGENKRVARGHFRKAQISTEEA
ncbi:TPR domain-containing protein [Colletotrichum truncatum]|uniref:TPR domain-containing protein n=1 Tax=Colletotrichum truncatum TaxID=5467 RepID=A0ACC3YEK3_COLTU|nr:TPR domain-containing protein [Colletotrichum truncatum]KAF6783328.1 TPR domain-containing protein [Colletotrichum truncatum]